MSTSLPQEVQTAKVSTLPDDLKAIAEKMLADKFGEEEVEVPRPKGFRGASTPPQSAHEGYRDEYPPNVGGGHFGDERFRGRPWNGIPYFPGSPSPYINPKHAYSLIRRNLMVEDHGMGIITYRSEIRVVDLETGKRDLIVSQCMINRMMDDDAPYARERAVLEKLTRDFFLYLRKINRPVAIDTY